MRGVLVCLCLVGCAGDPALRAHIAGLERQVDQYRRDAKRDQKKLDEIDNRVFVLEDKVDTQVVTSEREGESPPKLPVVKRAPDAGGETVADAYTDENGDDVVVVYEGDALEAPRKPTKLTLDESGEPTPSGDDGVAARSAPRARRGKGKTVAAGDKLPVQEDIPPAPSAGGSDEPLALYKRAYQALTSRDHVAAIAGFGRFLELYADHDYADNAQYWLAESFYDQREYKTALGEFRKVVKRYPDGNKAPDALLKIGYCYAKLGDMDGAVDVLTQVVEIYPKTEAAKLAAKRLEELRTSK